MGEMSDYRDFFGKNAEKYASSKPHKSGRDLEELVLHLNLESGDYCVDLATGTGFTAFALARRVAKVAALDGTPQMLQKAKKLATEQDIHNIEFVAGRVENLPFQDSSFDVITCRRAAHHFADKTVFLKESFRVLKPGGRIGIVDFVEPESDSENLLNQMEIIRDRSHVSAETLANWNGLVRDSGFTVEYTQELAEMRPFEEWLYPVNREDPAGSEILEFVGSRSEEELGKAGFLKKDMILRKQVMVLIARKER